VAEPVVVRHAAGARLAPVIWTTSLKPILVHDRVVELLRERKLSGWDIYPVTIRDKHDMGIDQFWGLSFLGRCGPIDNERSSVVAANFPAGVFP
jgi:hypothetical protein